jgi:hypothetical protein
MRDQIDQTLRWRNKIQMDPTNKHKLTDDKITVTKIRRDKEFKNLIKATWGPAL